MRNILLTIGAAALAATMGQASAQDLLSGETNNAGSSIHATLVALAEVTSDSKLANIQIQDGQVLTKSLINVATGRTDIATIPTTPFPLLAKGAGPYADLGAETGAKLSGNVRALFGFTPGVFVPIAYTDSGIKSWEDFRGKNIFVGPPASGAGLNVTALLKAVTGMEPGKDYNEVRVDWDAAQQYMLDRRVDVFFTPAAEPSPLVQQIISSGPVTIFGVPKHVYETDAWREAVNQRGTTESVHTTGSYEGEVTYANATAEGEMKMMAYTFFMGVNAAMPENKVYQLTKTFFDSQDRVDQMAAFMPSLQIRKGIVGLSDTPGLKLHPGAVRALKEQGIDVPNQLIP